MDLYVFDANGMQIASSAFSSDGDEATDDTESISIEDVTTVQPNSTYYVGIYGWVGGDFEMYYDAEDSTVTVLFENFDSGTLTWTTSETVNGSPASVWNVTNANSYSGAYSVSVGTYQDNTLADLESPDIDLTGYTSPSDITLAFYEYYDTESCCDDVEIWIWSNTTSTWTTLASRFGTNFG